MKQFPEKFYYDFYSKVDDEVDEDYEKMKSWYPAQARRYWSAVENECDKMEYKGSCMYDERPDFATIDRIARKIGNAFGCKEQECNLIHGMLCTEMHCRRRRYARRRKMF